MASRFSGALQITNLDDFITPSEVCIKPVEVKIPSSKSGAKIKIQEDGTHLKLDLKDSAEKLDKVEITLADCLACSGCITSAESVLITQQSQEELLRIFKEKQEQLQNGKVEDCKFIVVSLSVQPVLSLAARYVLKPDEAVRRLARYFRTLGADMILDMTVAEDFALLESAKEFVERHKSAKEGASSQLPMLASSCPGWVCYAEKTHGNFVLPFISVTKSPQQIMGSLVKYRIAETKGLSPDNIYHITLMPCYDKKLEAYREDFNNKLKDTRDVDCVITAIELEQMLEQQGTPLNEIKPDTLDKPFGSCKESNDIDMWSHRGSGSGGYAHYIYEYAARNLFQIEDPHVQFRTLRNTDFQEAVLERDGQVLLRFAIANGFRNIQNIVQKLKRGKCTYDYVEMMACPAGCMNGGAQIRPLDNTQPRELASRLESAYRELPSVTPDEDEAMHNLYRSWLAGENSDKAYAYLQTQYHEIEKMMDLLESIRLPSDDPLIPVYYNYMPQLHMQGRFEKLVYFVERCLFFFPLRQDSTLKKKKAKLDENTHLEHVEGILYGPGASLIEDHPSGRFHDHGNGTCFSRRWL